MASVSAVLCSSGSAGQPAAGGVVLPGSVLARTTLVRPSCLKITAAGGTKAEMQAEKAQQLKAESKQAGTPAEGKGPVQQSVKSKRKCQPHIRKRKS
eukprot:2559041-Pleurochrysis_carterae.AAC.4